MIIKNLPSEFSQLQNDPVFEFSDDSRLIYIHSSNGDWNEVLYHRIAVFDIIYNKLVMLSPDESLSNIFSTNYEFDTWRPKIHIVSWDTLLILFNSSAGDDDNEALVLVVKLNFSENSYSLFDSKIVRDCSSAFVVKNGDKYLLLHEFVHEGIRHLGYYTFILQDDRISEFQEDRLIFDYDYDNAGLVFLWHVYDNKLWFFRRRRVEILLQVSYFDLSEASPKEKQAQIIENMYDLMFQWSDGRLLRYNQAEGELSYLNLDDNQWSKIYRCNELQKLVISRTNFMPFWKFNTFNKINNSFNWHFESDFKAILINLNKNQLIKIPFNEPEKLLDIAWASVLNYGLLEELESKRIVIFPKII